MKQQAMASADAEFPDDDCADMEEDVRPCGDADQALDGSEPPPAPRVVNRGLTSGIHPGVLQQIVWLRALETIERFRVVRAIDIALACFPERPFKAALTAAQRAMRGLAKANLVRRYRTDRFQHVYGLTVPGARWLNDRGVSAASSIRRVADMSNPEHTLWMNFIVLASEARGLRAMSEREALQDLNLQREEGEAAIQGFLNVELRSGTRTLRPDAVAFEDDGLTWFEIDRSKRGADREAALSALTGRVGMRLPNQAVLRRVVVLARTERIWLRARAVLRAKAALANDVPLVRGSVRHFREAGDGVFEVWAAVTQEPGGYAIDVCVGHVIIQMLPTWLPKVRLGASNRQPLAGWFDENYLPYRRPEALPPWPSPTSPLLKYSRSSQYW
ncbi:replication-relaxation family protein [Burkholderia thailandensis]|uniref:replication-relaxation family protein n=1 Tax=Burkholderia TaxID=32008 RepID=UPI00217D3060|nr:MULTISPECIES: replication-relaxation family protein [Burkholderia]MCS6479751.1 replication-relaxation family protein [Burkholderia thailandensis]MDN7815872.1 replication-relaxation family protein [Burkholderia vietnamiensis]